MNLLSEVWPGLKACAMCGAGFETPAEALFLKKEINDYTNEGAVRTGL